MSSRLLRNATLLLVLLTGRPAPTHAQDLRVAGAARDSASDVIRAIEASGRFLLLDRDTVLPADFLHVGDVVIAEATVWLEGRVDGRVAILNGELFVRPGAAITGPIAVASGGFYPSGLATIGPVHQVPLDVAVQVQGGDNGVGVQLTPPAPPPRLAPTGLFGVGVPTYDRVDGLTLRGGATFRLGGDPDGARLYATALLHTRRGAPGGFVGVETPLRRGVWGVAEGGRRTVTNDRWIRGDLFNSVTSLLNGSDLRNYYTTDYAEVRLERRLAEPMIQGESFAGPRVGIRVSDDRSLSAGDPWSLFSRDGDWRSNPPVLETRLISALAGSEFRWRGATTRLDGDLGLEWGPGAVNDTDFLQAVADIRTEAVALRGHLLSLRFHAIGTLSESAAPPQRWSFVGGPNTIPTEPDARYLGDQLVFVQSTYAIPVPDLVVPVLGSPSLTLLHAAGMAWRSDGERPDWRQNLGVGARFRLAFVRLWADPATHLRKPVLSVGASLGF